MTEEIIAHTERAVAKQIRGVLGRQRGQFLNRLETLIGYD